MRRYAVKDGKRARVWKYSAKVAELAAQYFLTVAMVKPVSETGTLLQDLMTEWALLHSDLPSVSQTLPNMIRKLIQPAESAVHIYLFCQVLVNQVKFAYIETYIHNITLHIHIPAYIHSTHQHTHTLAKMHAYLPTSMHTGILSLYFVLKNLCIVNQVPA